MKLTEDFSGIYKITSPSGKVYIGQSLGVLGRWEGYFKLRCKSQVKLYNSLSLYGTNSHVFEILEEVDREYLDDRELFHWQCHKFLGIELLNLKKPGKSPQLSQESIEKMKKSKIGKPLSKEHKIKIGLGNKGKILTEKQKKNISLSLLGIKKSEESKKRQSETRKNKKIDAWNKGRKCSEEDILRIKSSLKSRDPNSYYRVPIIQLSLSEDIIKEWSDKALAEKELKINNISRALKSKNRSAGGYKWRKKNEIIFE